MRLIVIKQNKENIMEAYISVKPVFNLTLSKEIVLLLSRKSKEHYDAACRKVSEQGGFIYGWVNCIDFDVTCDASFRELDLTLKICEGFNHLGSDSDNDKILMREYSDLVKRLLEKSNEFIKDLPKITVK